MDYLSGGVSNLTSIPTRRHPDLQVLTSNDHPWYSAEPNRIAQTSFTKGLDASKTATPSIGSVYYATDTSELYECFATNVWVQVSDICIPASPTTGDIIYYDGAKWNRLAAGANLSLLTSGGAGVAPSWQTFPAMALVSRTVNGSNTNAWTISSIPSREYMRFVIISPTPGTTVYPTVQFNSDTGSNYGYYGSTNMAAGSASGAFTSIQVGHNTSAPWIYTLDVMNLSGSNKQFIAHWTSSASAATNTYVWTGQGVWVNTSAQINAITIGDAAEDNGIIAGVICEVYGSPN
jgi:hypothetical protein